MISGTVITLNEAGRIGDCIRSLQPFCAEIIVVDSGSSDETCRIAESLGARVIVNRFEGDGPQKLFASEQARHDWIMTLDADERATPEMSRWIESASLDEAGYDGYSFRRRTFVGQRWMRYGGWYPDRIVRLYDRRRTNFKPTIGHSAVTAKNVFDVDADILHYSYASISDVIYGQKYTRRDAYKMYLEGKSCNALTPVTHGAWAFFRSLVLRRGILGGQDGLTLAVSTALRAYMKYSILNEIHEDPTARLRIEEQLKSWGLRLDGEKNG